MLRMFRSVRAAPVALGGLALAALAGCQEYYFQIVEPTRIKEANVVVPAATPTPADILFVVDNSCSMEDEQDNLANNFSFFINEIAGSNLDYRIAVVSTDVEGGPNGVEREGLRVSRFKDPEPRTLISIDDSDCREVGTRHGCFRGPETTRVVTSSMAAAMQISAFTDNVKLGSCGSGTETGLLAMQTALQKARGDCNAGFLREDANLIVVIVSDENDQDNTNIQNYVQFLKGLKRSAAQLRVAVIAGAQGGAAQNCRLGGGTCGGTCQRRPPEGSGATGCRRTPSICPSDEFCDGDTCRNRDLQFFDDFCYWCSYYDSSDCCSALSGDRYLDFAQAIEREVAAADPSVAITQCRREEGKRIACLIDSVCQENFGETLRSIARDLVSTTTYTLDPAPCNPAGVVVRINGQELKNGEDFTVNGAVLNLNTAPAPEDVLEMFFVVEGCGPAPM